MSSIESTKNTGDPSDTFSQHSRGASSATLLSNSGGLTDGNERDAMTATERANIGRQPKGASQWEIFKGRGKPE